jgi:hypothetical protein
VHVTEGRNSAALSLFYDQLGPQRRDLIQAAATQSSPEYGPGTAGSGMPGNSEDNSATFTEPSHPPTPLPTSTLDHRRETQPTPAVELAHRRSQSRHRVIRAAPTATPTSNLIEMSYLRQ